MSHKKGKGMTDKKHSEESKRKMSINHNGGRKKGQKHSLESRKKISVTRKERMKLGIIKKTRYWLGKKNTEHSKRMKGKNVSPKTQFKKGHIPWIKGKKVPSLAKFGDKNPAWQGGLSFEPYSFEFTLQLKELIRKEYKYKCQICNKKQKKRKLSIHHIDYNKKNCNPDNLVPLCNSCHNKTQWDRKKWIKYFGGLNNE